MGVVMWEINPYQPFLNFISTSSTHKNELDEIHRKAKFSTDAGACGGGRAQWQDPLRRAGTPCKQAAALLARGQAPLELYHLHF